MAHGADRVRERCRVRTEVEVKEKDICAKLRARGARLNARHVDAAVGELAQHVVERACFLAVDLADHELFRRACRARAAAPLELEETRRVRHVVLDLRVNRRESVQLARTLRADRRPAVRGGFLCDHLRRARRARDLDELRVRVVLLEEGTAQRDGLGMRVDAPHLGRAAFRHELVVDGPDELAHDFERVGSRERVERDADRSLERVFDGHERRLYRAVFHGLHDGENIRIDDELLLGRQKPREIERRRLAVRAQRP